MAGTSKSPGPQCPWDLIVNVLYRIKILLKTLPFIKFLLLFLGVISNKNYINLTVIYSVVSIEFSPMLRKVSIAMQYQGEGPSSINSRLSRSFTARGFTSRDPTRV